MKVKTIREFIDLTCNKKTRKLGEEFIVSDERAKILLQKGFVEQVIETASISNKSKEKAIKKDSKEKI